MRSMKLFAFVALVSFVLVYSGLAIAQDERTPEQTEQPAAAQQQPAPLPSAIFKPQGTVFTPLSSVSSPGKGVHTNYKIFVPTGQKGLSVTAPLPFVPAGQKGVSNAVAQITFAEYTASMACVYGVGGTSYAGCRPGIINSAYNATGGWGAIALVDAYDDPNAASDLSNFSSVFGLPQANFKTVIANSSFGSINGVTASCSGTPPNASAYGWDVEEALDIEWAHAMAPAAQIILVEACSQSLPDLLFAEYVAGMQVSAAGGGDISNSWGYPESCVGVPSCGGGSMTQVQDDNFFYRYFWKNITYFASAGDIGSEVLYPSASPWVVSAGGTTVNRDASGNFLSESCWAASGGGNSTVETWQNPPTILNGMGPWSAYQYELFGGAPYSFPFRSTPDISFNADPASGVWVYSGGAWYVVGGTSVSSPALAGIVNASNNRLGQAPPAGGYYETQENNLLYSQLYAFTAYPTNFYDVTTGSNGHAAGVGYDQCTGIGSPRGKLGK